MALYSMLDPILNPALALNPLISILLMSFFIVLVMTLIYKWMTNQVMMKQMKDDIKKYQKEMKEHKSDPSKVMEIQKKAMEVNMKYMSHSMKPTLVSFIPIILIFGWMQANLAYGPLIPGQEFSVEANFAEGITGNTSIKIPDGFNVDNLVKEIIDGKAEWKLTAPALKNEKGDSYTLEFEKDNEVVGKNIFVTYRQKYEEPIKSFKDGKFKIITVKNKPLKPMGNMSIFGWMPGWLGIYIITSIIFSLGLRKILKLH